MVFLYPSQDDALFMGGERSLNKHWRLHPLLSWSLDRLVSSHFFSLFKHSFIHSFIQQVFSAIERKHRSEGNLLGVSFLLHHVCSKDCTLVIRFGGKCIYAPNWPPISLLTNNFHTIFHNQPSSTGVRNSQRSWKTSSEMKSLVHVHRVASPSQPLMRQISHLNWTLKCERNKMTGKKYLWDNGATGDSFMAACCA